MASPPVLAFVIVGGEDHPIYEADLAPPPRPGDAPPPRDERAQYLHQFVLHAALDAVDEAQWAGGAMHLGVVDKFNNLQVSAFVTASRLRLLLLHDGRPDDAVRAFFRDAHEALLKAVLNPFFSPSARIASPAFDRKVRALARVHFRQ